MSNKILSEIEAEVSLARSRYQTSGGEEWLELSLALMSLCKEYRANKYLDKADACYKEYSSVIREAKEKMKSRLWLSDNDTDILDNSWDIQLWADRERKSRDALKKGGSPIEYAKTVYALCEYLRPSVQSDICPIEKSHLEWAALKYREALEVLLACPEDKINEQERLYMTMVISLEYSECERALGHISMARIYSLFPLLYLAENFQKEALDVSSINWDYVSSLCKTIISKQMSL